MEYVKGSLIVGEREVMVELPSDWRTSLSKGKFLLCKSYLGEDTAFNTSMIFNVREVDDVAWNNWLTRIEMEKEKLRNEALKSIENKE